MHNHGSQGILSGMNYICTASYIWRGKILLGFLMLNQTSVT